MPRRKSLSDTVGKDFVYGDPPAEPQPDPKPTPPKPKKTPSKKSLRERMMAEATTAKEKTKRTTVDLPESLHIRLGVFCAQVGKSKAEVIRECLDDLLSEE